MRVLIITPYAVPLSVGGFQNQIYQVAINLRKLGVTTDFYNCEKINIKDYDILQVMSPDASMRSIISRFKSAGVPIVMTPMCGSQAVSNFGLTTRLLLSKIPVLFTADRFNAMVLRLGDFFLPLTDFEKKRLKQVYGISNNKIKVIPNGLDETFFSNDIQEVKLPYSHYLLVVGRIEPNKNQFNLIQAVNKLGLNLIIIGEAGAYNHEYIDQCKSISKGNVYYWGVEKNKLLLKYLYKNATLTVVPSYSEMAPLVVFESLKMRTPVLCTSHCGFSSLNIPGLFFTEITTKGLIKTIPLAMKCDNRVISMDGIYQWEDIASQYLSVYNQLLER